MTLFELEVTWRQNNGEYYTHRFSFSWILANPCYASLKSAKIGAMGEKETLV
jgi:hypothetical protein